MQIVLTLDEIERLINIPELIKAIENGLFYIPKGLQSPCSSY